MHEPIILLGKASLKKHLNQFHFSKGRKISRVKGGRGRTEDDERCFGGGLCTLKSTAPSQSHKFPPIPKCWCKCIIFTNTKTNANERHDLTKAATMQRRILVPSHYAKKGAHANTKQEKQPQMEISIW